MIRVLGRTVAALSLGLAAIALPGAASAATSLSFTNTVGGETVGTGPWTLTSTDSTFSILRFVNNETLNFGDLTSLSLDFDVLQGGIGGGAPRIAVVTDADHDTVADGQVLIYLGPSPSFVDTSLGFHSSGNLIGLNDSGRYDLSGIGGSQTTDYNAALAAAGAFGVLRFSVILDSFGGADKAISIATNGLQAAGNVTAAPVVEPAAWALMIGGFGLAGAMLRRRRALATV